MFERNALSVDVATRIRILREEQGLSMRELAAKSNLSANAISTIERGKVSPAVSTLYRIADALGVPVTSFFSPTSDKDRLVFLKAGERTRVPFQRGLWEGLGGERFAGRVEPFLLTLESGGGSGIHSMVHTGHEFVLCLRGQLEYQIEDQTFVLEAGDSLLFAAYLKHRWRNIGDKVVNALIVLSDFSEGDSPSIMHMAIKSYGE